MADPTREPEPGTADISDPGSPDTDIDLSDESGPTPPARRPVPPNPWATAPVISRVRTERD